MSESKVKIGVIGCGLASTWHLDYLKSDSRSEIVALCDVDKNNMLNAVERLGEGKKTSINLYTGYEDLLKSEKLNAVLILTPHKFHFAQVKASLERGLHVLAEKPLVVSSEKARELISLAKRVRRILMVSYQYPLRGPVKYVRNLIKAGGLGDIVYFNAMLAIHWHKLATGWRLDPEISEGGALVDSGSHLIDLVLHLTGAKVERLVALADYRGHGVDIFNSALVQFNGGRTGILSMAGEGPFLLDLTIVGTKGAVTMRDLETVTYVKEENFIGEIGTYHQRNEYATADAPKTTLPTEEFLNSIISGDL
ncbi:MAG: Gfo/Idh/MocA family protein, partial [Candidatus Kryptoniota bacterium]